MSHKQKANNNITQQQWTKKKKQKKKTGLPGALPGALPAGVCGVRGCGVRGWRSVRCAASGQSRPATRFFAASEAEAGSVTLLEMIRCTWYRVKGLGLRLG